MSFRSNMKEKKKTVKQRLNRESDVSGRDQMRSAWTLLHELQVFEGG